MLTRVVTGLILAPLVILAAWFAPDTAGAGLVVLAAGLAVKEYYHMWTPALPKWTSWLMVGWTMAAPLLARVAPEYIYPYLLATPALCLSLFLLMPARIPQAFGQTAVLGMGTLYVGLMLTSVVELTMIEGKGAVALLSLFAVVWLGDSFAYFGGKTLGRHKLYPAVSPKKTIEGSIAGLAGSVGGIFLIDALAGTGLSTVQLVLLGLLGGAAEQIGDLAESVLKRSVGVKDSGALLPGHGGMLDRIDGLLFAAPVAWIFFVLQV